MTSDNGPTQCTSAEEHALAWCDRVHMPPRGPGPGRLFAEGRRPLAGSEAAPGSVWHRAHKRQRRVNGVHGRREARLEVLRTGRRPHGHHALVDRRALCEGGVAHVTRSWPSVRGSSSSPNAQVSCR